MIERRSESEGEAETLLADISTKSFCKRPSLRDAAFLAIGTFMNNAVFVKNKPGHVYYCDAAFLMMKNSSFRWMISGTSRVLHFLDRKLVHQSDEREYPRIGMQPSYNPEPGPTIKCEKGENAFFLCSKSLTDAIGTEGIEKALGEASSQDDWMKRIEEMASETDFAAQALIMPEKKKKPLTVLIVAAVIIVAALFLCWYFMK